MSSLRTPWRGVAAAFMLNGLLLGAWASRIPAIMERHSLSEATLGILLLVLGLGAVVSFPVAGRLSDDFGAVRLTRLLAVISLVMLVMIGLAPTPILLGAALLVFGMGFGAMDVTMNSWATEVEKTLGRPVMSSFHAMWSLGTALGAGSGYVAASIGLPVGLHFLLAALAAALILGPFTLIPWESRRRGRGAPGPVFALPRGQLVLVGVLALSAGLSEGAMADWSAVYLRDVIGAGEARATLGYAVFSVTMVAMRLCVDRLVLRFGPVRMARISGAAVLCGLALLVIPATMTAALIGFVLMGLGCAALIPLAFSRAAADPDVPPGQAIAAVATLGYGAMLLGPPAIGFIAEIFSLRLSFALLSVFAAMVVALAPILAQSGRSTAGDASG
ncbi:MFS transporter [Paracoccus sediminicola]|uniref:MFS transporter n=1 Tax=Paracoccus sediminicola TaxID=3017783 RepID=UPI0022F09A98|nr:MFS transporter [Paracoccus sediminicola]WBU57069.1 MFS transporter [Paracoccus sediminicola]